MPEAPVRPPAGEGPPAPGRDDEDGLPDERRCPPLWPPPFVCAFGDDAYGLWIDVEISGVVQRFRWIEPGEFSMGSPDNETERSDGEGPRHRVRLTAGFWLADTACTQQLWQAVMGSNPSRFQDEAQNPVENVSWDDVQDFLGGVRSSVPGVTADLPSEAEWEYACRAGSETPFSTGPTIDTAQANFDGNYPYAGGERGIDRERTVPVKSFAPNAWGLYEMHGNVWEWCADGMREYTDETVDDPRGPEGAGDWRVVRGGSWGRGAGGLRSATRCRWRRGERLDLRGFRLSLRSIAAERAPGAERLAQRAPVERDA
ncbi:formylglycine-generating enzyme family protein [Accumulibacter sp.]|uniref:formylglycine-generating enzyme family protein n=1 Tax=Accumulibacter sp. TaxID=2053492 RepID=UPI0025D7A754|nr:formylglycine-generating enzyme family protein [Accumulibacter sp.]MCM8595755.1 formylglycine-generating enzyme family protein [Accumulibacter sp.]MCM8626604.1 formylglycine-generating enzyme family protein [Accumulibacter sp.]MDS4049903.1 formylglycine-generating enzyme family protein [Accumulibacter sp.]